jgi:hypothetical protein
MLRLRLTNPCRASQADLPGEDESVRHCAVCDKDVHNLSAMDPEDARALLRDKRGESLCVRVKRDATGNIRFRTAAAALMLTSCSSALPQILVQPQDFDGEAVADEIDCPADGAPCPPNNVDAGHHEQSDVTDNLPRPTRASHP